MIGAATFYWLKESSKGTSVMSLLIQKTGSGHTQNHADSCHTHTHTHTYIYIGWYAMVIT